MIDWFSASLAWLGLAGVGAAWVLLDSTRPSAALARPASRVFAALAAGAPGALVCASAARRARGAADRAVLFAGAAAPGVLLGDLVAVALGLPVAAIAALAAAAGAASSLALARAEGAPLRPLDVPPRIAALVAGMTPALALLLPTDARAWSLASPLHWGVLSVAFGVGLVVLVLVERGIEAWDRRSLALGRRAHGIEEAFVVALLLVGAGFGAASPAGTLRADEARALAACAGEAETMTSMPGMGAMAGMDMGPAPPPHGCPEAGASGMMEMGGMDMRPAETAGQVLAPPDARGGRLMEGTLRADGVRLYELRAGLLRWNILPDVTVDAYAYNDQLPGPLLRLVANESVVIRVQNALPENTTVHLHGLQIPNDMDGVPYVEQRPILPGETFEYAFRVPDTPGTFFYHTHFAADRQQPLGLYGGLLIAREGAQTPVAADVTVMLGEWAVRDGTTIAAMLQPGMMPNYFTINGKSFPETEDVRVKVGDRVRLRIVGSGQFIHPMHLHGQPFEIVATDGNPVPAGARLLKDTVLVGPGERYDVEFTARAPGTWLFHCHINDHITNNGEEIEGGGGLTMRIIVEA